jgi:hypothetical protein
MERCRARSIYSLDCRQSRCRRCDSRRGRSAQGALEPCWNGQARRGEGDFFHLTYDEIVLLVMVYAKSVQANVKSKDIKRG